MIKISGVLAASHAGLLFKSKVLIGSARARHSSTTTLSTFVLKWGIFNFYNCWRSYFYQVFNYCEYLEVAHLLWSQFM